MFPLMAPRPVIRDSTRTKSVPHPKAVGRIVKPPSSRMRRVSWPCRHHHTYRLWLAHAEHAGLGANRSHEVKRKDTKLNSEGLKVTEAAVRACNRAAKRHVVDLRLLWKTRTAIERWVERKANFGQAMRRSRARKAQRAARAKLMSVPRGLLKLPPELRNTIYELLVLTPTDTSTDGRTTLSLFNKHPAITQINKQTRAESLTMYCGENQFLVCLGRVPDGFNNSATSKTSFHNYDSFIGWLECICPLHAGYYRNIVCCFSDFLQPLSTIKSLVERIDDSGLQTTALHWAMSRPTLLQLHTGYAAFVQGVFRHQVSFADPTSQDYRRDRDGSSPGLYNMVVGYLTKRGFGGPRARCEVFDNLVDLFAAWLEKDGPLLVPSGPEHDVAKDIFKLNKGYRAFDTMKAELKHHVAPGQPRGFRDLWSERCLHAERQSNHWLEDVEAQIGKYRKLHRSYQPSDAPTSASALSIGNWLDAMYTAAYNDIHNYTRGFRHRNIFTFDGRPHDRYSPGPRFVLEFTTAPTSQDPVDKGVKSQSEDPSTYVWGPPPPRVAQQFGVLSAFGLPRYP